MAGLLVVRGTCPGCAVDFADSSASVSITAIEATRDGWRAVGDVELGVTCPNCGMYYKAVQHFVPIECAAYLCPKCGESTSLACRVRKLARKATGDYEFIAEMTCTRCQRRSVLRRILDQLDRITSIRVDVVGTGIEVGREPAPPRQS